MLRLLTAVLILFVTARPVSAEPLDRRQLPARTAWFVHLDIETAKPSVLAQAVRDNWLDQPAVKTVIERARKATGMDPTREIRSLTLYGLSYAPDQTVLVVRGKVDRPRLEMLLKGIPGYRREIVEGHELHFWTENQSRGGSALTFSRVGAFVRDDTIAISPDPKTLVLALNVLEGKAPSLSADSPLALAAREGTILQAAATGFAEAKNLPIQSPLLRQCESGSIVLGEQGGVVFFHGKLIARSAETAADVKAAFDVWRGIAMRSPAENTAAMLRPLKMEEDDKTINVDWGLSAKELVKIFQDSQANLSAAIAKDKTP